MEAASAATCAGLPGEVEAKVLCDQTLTAPMTTWTATTAMMTSSKPRRFTHRMLLLMREVEAWRL